MSLSNLRDSLIEEAATMLGKDFSVEVTSTKTIPHSGDPKVTFPNLDERRQSCKLIDTCVLYIDMRRSTELSLRLRPHTVVKLYSTFVRVMTRCARYYQGHVRGIIGDRVMVLFDEDNAFANALDCAVLMHSAAKYVINRYFASGEVTFGIGIDAGKMLVTKTGIRKNGTEQNNYRNLVWLGRPANIASKLTDAANKAAETFDLVTLNVIYERRNPFTGQSQWDRQWELPHEFIKNLQHLGWPSQHIRHRNPEFRGLFPYESSETVKPATPPILMTEKVWKGFATSKPTDAKVTKGWFSEIGITVPGLAGKVYGGDVIKSVFEQAS